MAETPSTMVPLGTPAPDFKLRDPASGKIVARDDFRAAKGLLVMFICNHCPFVKHIRKGLSDFGRDYQPRGLAQKRRGRDEKLAVLLTVGHEL